MDDVENVRRRIAGTFWVKITLMVLSVLFLVFTLICAISLIVHSSKKDTSVVSYFFGFCMGLCVIGCLVTLGIAPDPPEASGHRPEMKSDLESKLKLESDTTPKLKDVSESFAPVTPGHASLAKGTAVSKTGSHEAAFQTAHQLAPEQSDKQPNLSVHGSAQTSQREESESKLKLGSDRAPEQNGASQIFAPVNQGAPHPAPMQSDKQPNLRVHGAAPTSQREQSEQKASTPQREPSEQKILEATEQEVAEVKTILGGSLDPDEEDVLRQIVVEDKKDEALQKEIVAAECQEKALTSLSCAITSREIMDLREAIKAASDAELPSTHSKIVEAKSVLAELDAMQKEISTAEKQEKALALLSSAIASRETMDLREALEEASDAELSPRHSKVIEAKSVLAELDAMLAAYRELANAMHEAELEELKNIIKSAREAGVEGDLLSTADSKVKKLEAQEAAQAKLDAAIVSRESRDLLIALEAASNAGLRGDAPRVAHAQAIMKEVDALKELLAAIQTTADISRLKKALEAAKEAGVAEDGIAAGQARVNELELKLAATEKLKKASAAREAHLLKSAMAHAATVGLSDSDMAFTEATRILAEVEAAAAALAAEERKQAAEEELRVAVASRNIDFLRAALEEAAEADLTASPIMDEAKRVLLEEVAKEETRQELSAMVQQGESDVAKLRVAVGKASDVGLGLDEDIVVRIKGTLAKEEAKIAAMAELESSIAQGEKADPKDPFSLEKARDRLIAGVARAREVGFTDTNAALHRASMMRRHLHNMLQDLLGATRVFCRVRPTNSREKKLESSVVVKVVDGMMVEVEDDDGELHKFEFDAAFGPTSTQEQIFAECKDLVQSVLDGYNITIFAYGQTGAGKTFTMTGVNDPPELKGVQPRTIEALFEAIQRESSRYDIIVTAFMVEVYCSKVNDLGAGQRKEGGVKVRCVDDKVTLDGVNERPISTAADLFALFAEGNSQKKVIATAMNAGSSRGHTILGINVLVKSKDTQKEHAGKILLVDLAGSERLKKSEVSGAGRKEAIEINKSLTALGDVVSAITLGKRVPYRNHTLTMLMSDSLGGTAKTLMFINASPALDNADETIMALNFATRAKTITTREAAVVALQAARRGIVDRRIVKEFRMSQAADVTLAAVKFKK